MVRMRHDAYPHLAQLVVWCPVEETISWCFGDGGGDGGVGWWLVDTIRTTRPGWWTNGGKQTAADLILREPREIAVFEPVDAHRNDRGVGLVDRDRTRGRRSLSRTTKENSAW